MIKAIVASLPMFLSSMVFASPLSGTYQASSSQGCKDLQIPATLTVVAEPKGLHAGPYDFQVGVVNEPPPPGFYNEFFSQFVSAYSQNGNKFSALENIIDRLNPTVVYRQAGEVSFELHGKSLEISDSLTTDGQFNPAPVAHCTLNKID